MICVDPLCNYGWRLGASCHMFIFPGDLEELHVFARHLGLRRAWFQDHPSLPHYDLTASRRRLAVTRGAVQVPRRGTVDAMRAWRTHKEQRQRDRQT